MDLILEDKSARARSKALTSIKCQILRPDSVYRESHLPPSRPQSNIPHCVAIGASTIAIILKERYG